MRRILLVLVVAAVVAAVMAVSAASAFAHDLSANQGCKEGYSPATTDRGNLEASYDRNGDGWVCFQNGGNRITDNHIHR